MPFKTGWYRFILTDKGHCDIMVTNSKEGGNGYMNTRYPEKNQPFFCGKFKQGMIVVGESLDLLVEVLRRLSILLFY